MDDRRTHLKACTDAAAHDAHAKAQADAKAKKRQREDLDDAAATAQARAVWEASGAQTSKLWMLPDAALVEMIGGDTDGLDRTELIARAAASRDAGGRRLLTDGRAGGRAPAPPADSLPANYATLDAAQLRGICAARLHTKGHDARQMPESKKTDERRRERPLLWEGTATGGNGR